MTPALDNNIIDDRIEDYLDGRLTDTETRRFERDLLKRDVATAFHEALMMRELLKNLPSDEPSPDLFERIEASLNLDSTSSTEKTATKRPSNMKQIVDSFKWGFRWTGYAFAGISGSSTPLRRSLSGMDTVGYTLGPLNEPVRGRLKAIRLPVKPLWKIALSKVW